MHTVMINVNSCLQPLAYSSQIEALTLTDFTEFLVEGLKGRIVPFYTFYPHPNM